MDWKDALREMIEEVIRIAEHDSQTDILFDELEYQFPTYAERQVTMDEKTHNLTIYVILDNELPAALKYNN